MKKNVKGLLITVVLFLFTISGSAQTIGLKGGLNLSTISGYEDVFNAMKDLHIPGVPDISGYSTGYAAGFHFGLMFQYDLPANFFLQPELLFSTQGLKEEATGHEAETSRLNFLQVPVYAGYKIDAGLGLNIILAAGPYLAYGISGSEGAYGDDGTFKRFDAGLSAMGGIQFNKLQITAGYDFGLVDQIDVDGWNTLKDILGLSSVQNRNIKISAGYFF
jgi:hypothetical protein